MSAIGRLAAMNAGDITPRGLNDIGGLLNDLFVLAHGNILELGTRNGNSTTALLAGVEQRGGHVYSVDINPACAGIWCKDHPQWTFFCSDSTVGGLLDKIPQTLDLLFVDTTHNVPTVTRELNMWGLRAPLIAVHDVLDDGYPGYADAVKQWAGTNRYSYETINWGPGLGILRRRDGSRDYQEAYRHARPVSFASACDY